MLACKDTPHHIDLVQARQKIKVCVQCVFVVYSVCIRSVFRCVQCVFGVYSVWIISLLALMIDKYSGFSKFCLFGCPGNCDWYLPQENPEASCLVFLLSDLVRATFIASTSYRSVSSLLTDARVVKRRKKRSLPHIFRCNGLIFIKSYLLSHIPFISFSSDQLRREGLSALQMIINVFCNTLDPDYDNHALLEQYQAQVMLPW